MKLLVFILIVVATSLVAADYTVYDFAGNTSSTVDPYNLLNYRYLDYSVNEAYHLGFLRSLRSEIDSDEEWAEIDTIGSLVSYNALPSTFLAFWEGEAQWSNKSFDTSDADSALLSGITTLIERNKNGAVVRSFSLSQASSNASVGVSWDAFDGSNLDDSLIWHSLNTTITATKAYGTFTFGVTITTFSAAVRGTIDLGDIEISPRSLKTAVKVSNYQYLESTNTLSLRVFCAYGTLNYRVTDGYISSGYGLDRVFVDIDDSAIRLPNDTARVGTGMNVSVSEWQILPGLRSPIAQSFNGYLLTGRFGSNWDVLYSDITLPAPNSLEPQNTIFTLSMGSSSTLSNSSEPNDPLVLPPGFQDSPSSASFTDPIPCILLFTLLASLLL